MKVSVALCTYNGGQYLRAQLDSIFAQTYPVDEVIVCDDGSRDETIDIVKDYQNRYKLIYLYQNVENLGVCENFQKAVDLCSGDVIFLSDQDDVWLPEKVRLILDWFDKNAEKDVVFSNAKLIDKESNIIYPDWSLFDAVGFSSVNRQLFDHGMGLELFMAWNRATGATMALRKGMTFVKECNHYVLHDEVIAVRALLNNRLGYISTPLTLYRIHELQHTGLSLSESNFSSRRTIADMSEYLLNAKRWSFYHEVESNERIRFHNWRIASAEGGYLMRICLSIIRYKQIFKEDYLLFFNYDIKKAICTLPRKYKKLAKKIFK